MDDGAGGYVEGMPGPKTYQAIGFVTYHLARRELRRREVARKAAEAGVAALAVGLAITAAALAARRDNGRPLP
jgi:hypothetical protein